MQPVETKPGLTGNQLKLFALVTMTIDHIGVQLFPQLPLLRILGRLSLPVFAYLIAEGCRHTHNRKRYLLRLAGLGALCQAVYFLAEGSLYMCILVTFSLSVLLVDALDAAVREQKPSSRLYALGVSAAVVFVCEGLPTLLSGTDFSVDYGLLGVLLPVFAYFGGLPAMAGCLVLLCLRLGGRQWWSLLALLPLLCYNGERGKHRMGAFFYLYYPLHLAVIYLVGEVFF